MSIFLTYMFGYHIYASDFHRPKDSIRYTAHVVIADITYHVCSGNQAWVFCRNSKYSLTAESCLQSYCYSQT